MEQYADRHKRQKVQQSYYWYDREKKTPINIESIESHGHSKHIDYSLQTDEKIRTF